MNNISSVIYSTITSDTGSIINVSNTAFSLITYEQTSPVNLSNAFYTIIMGNPAIAPAFSYAYIVD